MHARGGVTVGYSLGSGYTTITVDLLQNGRYSIDIDRDARDTKDTVSFY